MRDRLFFALVLTACQPRAAITAEEAAAPAVATPPATAFSRLEMERELISKRVCAFPDVAALKKRIDATRATPPCAKPYVGLMATSAPTGSCQRGPGCTWTYEVRTPNGCVASLWATFEIDSPTGDVRAFDLMTAQMIPYADWRAKKTRRP